MKSIMNHLLKIHFYINLNSLMNRQKQQEHSSQFLTQNKGEQMLVGMSIEETIRKLADQEARKEDILVKPNNLRITSNGCNINMGGGDGRMFDANPTFLSQLSAIVGIPKLFMERIRSAYPEQYEDLANAIYQRDTPQTRLIRGFKPDPSTDQKNHTARAILSDRYRRFDNNHIVIRMFPMIQELNLEIKCLNISDDFFHMEVVGPRTAPIEVGDEIQGGFALDNSETGLGSLRLTAFIYRLACRNGAIIKEESRRRNHVGRQQLSFDQDYWIQDDTHNIMSEAIWLQVRDHILHLTNDGFSTLIDRIKSIKKAELAHDEISISKDLQAQILLTEQERDRLLTLLVREEKNAWGVVNAVTALAHHTQDYERNLHFQAAGGTLMMKSPAFFKNIGKQYAFSEPIG
jgi:hypothetical protein